MSSSNMKIAVFGTGAWGTALASAFARAGNTVSMFGIDEKEIDDINKNHRNSKYFSDQVILPENIKAYNQMAEAINSIEAKAIALVVPSKAFDITLQNLKTIIPSDSQQDYTLIICAKGLDVTSNWLLTEKAKDIFPKANIACIGGPNFAKEVVVGKPSATTIAASDINIALAMAKKISSKTFKAYPTDDLHGVSMCGVLKNIYAIGAGILQSMDLGQSNQSFYITRALAEMARIIEKIGGNRETVLSLAGVGDLVLCCTSDMSRNMRFGLEFGRSLIVGDNEGSTRNRLLEKDSSLTIEGIRSTKVMYDYVQRNNIDAPIIKEIYMILFENKQVSDIINDVMSRPIRVEGE